MKNLYVFTFFEAHLVRMENIDFDIVFPFLFGTLYLLSMLHMFIDRQLIFSNFKSQAGQRREFY